MGRRITTKKFIERARKVHGDKYDYSKTDLDNRDEKGRICIICKEHGEFWQTPTNHLGGQRCYKCSKISMANKQRITEEDLRNKLINVFGNKYDLSKLGYIDYKHKVRLVCPIHGEFEQTPSNLIKGHGCPKCGNIKKGLSKMISQEKFEEMGNKIHDHKYIYTKADVHNRDKNGKVIIICPIHGEFKQNVINHIYGKAGCPKCKSSKLEQKIIKLLDSNNIKYEHQKRFDWLGTQKLDFYLSDYNVGIECQGEQHFIGSNFGSKTITDNESLALVKKRDKNKLNLCNEHNVRILYYSNKQYEDDIITDENKLLKEIKVNDL